MKENKKYSSLITTCDAISKIRNEEVSCNFMQISHELRDIFREIVCAKLYYLPSSRACESASSNHCHQRSSKPNNALIFYCRQLLAPNLFQKDFLANGVEQTTKQVK